MLATSSLTPLPLSIFFSSRTISLACKVCLRLACLQQSNIFYSPILIFYNKNVVFSNRDFIYFAFLKSSKSLVITGSLWYCCILFFGIRQLYISVVGQLRSEQETHFWKLLLNSNPILHISIIYMTDASIIPQKFDLALWLCVYTTFSIIRGF